MTHHDIRLREATLPQDLGRVQKLGSQHGLLQSGPATMLSDTERVRIYEAHQQSKMLCLAALVDGEIRGTATMLYTTGVMRGTSGGLEDVVVHQDYRGQEYALALRLIGALLFDAIEKQRARYVNWECEDIPARQRARTFYARIGAYLRQGTSSSWQIDAHRFTPNAVLAPYYRPH